MQYGTAIAIRGVAIDVMHPLRMFMTQTRARTSRLGLAPDAEPHAGLPHGIGDRSQAARKAHRVNHPVAGT